MFDFLFTSHEGLSVMVVVSSERFSSDHIAQILNCNGWLIREQWWSVMSLGHDTARVHDSLIIWHSDHFNRQKYLLVWCRHKSEQFWLFQRFLYMSVFTGGKTWCHTHMHQSESERVIRVNQYLIQNLIMAVTRFARVAAHRHLNLIKTNLHSPDDTDERFWIYTF